MKRVFCGTSGIEKIPSTHRLSEIPADAGLLQSFVACYGGDIVLRPAQESSLFQHSILKAEGNVIIATPTNSGKSLISYLLLFDEALKGNRVVLVEPLRALAHEKYEELQRIAEHVKVKCKKRVKVKITTGDYRLTDEFMNTKPESAGDQDADGLIIVATPERLDAISRARENIDWFSGISLVCIDEAHLIGDVHRGATLELLIAFLKTIPTKPRVILMSATIANVRELAEWLAPCIEVNNVPRYPTLEKWVYCLDEEEDSSEIVVNEIVNILQAPENSVVVFVYQTAAAEKLAHTVAQRISGKKITSRDLSGVMETGVAWFHAKLSTATKESVIRSMTSCKIRVAISTTALSMGVNLPATHVIVRDITFPGAKELDVSDLMQMLGRAGRGDVKGTGIILIGGNNLNREQEITNGIENEILPNVTSRLIPSTRENAYGRNSEDLSYIDRIGNQVLGIINRFGHITYNEMTAYLQNTLGGRYFESLREVLEHIARWKLAFFNEDTNEYELTHLGRVASECYLPPITAANLGQLMRDMLADSPSGLHISQLAPIDFVIILCLVSAEVRLGIRYSQALERQVAAYMEALPLEEKSYLYRTWIATSPESLYGSVKVENSQEEPRKKVYQATFVAMMIYDLARGLSAEQLNGFYRVDVDEIQEKIRDNSLWQLFGIERILEVRSFFFYLKSACDADPEQIRLVELAFRKASRTIFSLVANLKYRSRLGELVRGIKRIYPNAKSHPGEGTIRKLELSGITSIKDLLGKKTEDLVQLGISRVYADQIIGYIRRRQL